MTNEAEQRCEKPAPGITFDPPDGAVCTFAVGHEGSHSWEPVATTDEPGGVETPERHAFDAYKETWVCGFPMSTTPGHRCGQRLGARCHLSDDIVDDRAVPFEPPTTIPTVARPYMRHPPCAVECRVDGNQVYAAIGDPDAGIRGEPGGVIGFGDTLADALRDLAKEIEKEVEVHPATVTDERGVDLKPCPNCNTDAFGPFAAYEGVSAEDQKYVVSCTKQSTCGLMLSGVGIKTREMAIAAWNRRTPSLPPEWQAEIEVIQKRIEKATAGPWSSNAQDSESSRYYYSVEAESGYTVLDTGTASSAKDDADFIAHARTDIPRLLEMLRQVGGVK